MARLYLWVYNAEKNFMSFCNHVASIFHLGGGEIKKNWVYLLHIVLWVLIWKYLGHFTVYPFRLSSCIRNVFVYFTVICYNFWRVRYYIYKYHCFTVSIYPELNTLETTKYELRWYQKNISSLFNKLLPFPFLPPPLPCYVGTAALASRPILGAGWGSH